MKNLAQTNWQCQLRKVLLYVAYGDDLLYYLGVKASILSILNHCNCDNQPEIVVVSEKPELFSNYPIKHITITKKLKHAWSLQGKYHYRIKNRALAHTIDHLDLDVNDKILALDTDTYFTENINVLFDKITASQSLMFLDEGPLTKKNFTEYRQSYGAPITLKNGQIYTLSHEQHMWGSLMVGITAGQRALIDKADDLLIALHLHAPEVRTVEQFAMAQVLETHGSLLEGKNWVHHYSHKGRKSFAQANINTFFNKYAHYGFDIQLQRYPELRLRRTITAFVKEKFYKITQSNCPNSAVKTI